MADFFIIATPIGNFDDITLRAIKMLKEIDFMVCEEEREYKKLFGILGIPEKKFILCNEHTEKEAIELAIPLLKNGEKGALISDCGTPLFEDPGFLLIKNIRDAGFTITSLPGANSIITAITLAPFRIKDFYYTGLLPKDKEKRKAALLELSKRKEAIVIIDAPYRLLELLGALNEFFTKREIFIGFDLTMGSELLFYGTINTILQKIEKKDIKKGEYILIIKPVL